MSARYSGPYSSDKDSTQTFKFKALRGGVSAIMACLLLTGMLVPVEALSNWSVSGRAVGLYEAPLRAAIDGLVVAREDNTGYERVRYFGEWADADGDCQSTRYEVLIRDSRTRVAFDRLGCKVTTGRWVSSWNNSVLTTAPSIQVDHTVPVHEAWGSGAKFWSQSRRVAFYNDLGDPRTLSAQPTALNVEKGGQSPQNWMPPTNGCAYIGNWVTVKIRWGLTVNVGEKVALASYARSCPNVKIRVTRV